MVLVSSLEVDAPDVELARQVLVYEEVVAANTQANPGPSVEL